MQEGNVEVKYTLEGAQLPHRFHSPGFRISMHHDLCQWELAAEGHSAAQHAAEQASRAGADPAHCAARLGPFTENGCRVALRACVGLLEKICSKITEHPLGASRSTKPNRTNTQTEKNG